VIHQSLFPASFTNYSPSPLLESPQGEREAQLPQSCQRFCLTPSAVFHMPQVICCTWIEAQLVRDWTSSWTLSSLENVRIITTGSNSNNDDDDDYDDDDDDKQTNNNLMARQQKPQRQQTQAKNGQSMSNCCCCFCCCCCHCCCIFQFEPFFPFDSFSFASIKTEGRKIEMT